MLFRFWNRAVALFCATLALVVVGLVVCPAEYASTAKLFVRLGRENVGLDPTATTGQTGQAVSFNESRASEINSVVEVVRSRAVLEQVVDRLGPAYILKGGRPRPQSEPAAADEPPQDAPSQLPDSPATSTWQQWLSTIVMYWETDPREKAILKLEKNLNVWTPKESTVLSLSYEARSPQQAQRVLREVVDAFLDEHLRIHRTSGSQDFFQHQSDLLKQQLDAAAGELRDAKNTFGIASIEGRRAALQEQMNKVDEEALAAETALAASQAKIDSTRDMLGRLPPHVVSQFVAGLPNDTISALRRQLYDLEIQEQQVLSTVTEHHPKALAIRRQVEEAKRILAGEAPSHQQAMQAALLAEQATADSLGARLDSLRQQQARLHNELTQLNQQAVRIADLERHVQLLEANYLAYARSLEQTRVDQALKLERISNVNLIQAPTLVAKPVKPRKDLVLGLGLLAALGGAVALALVSDQLDTSLKSADEAERVLKLPVLLNVSARPEHRLFGASV